MRSLLVLAALATACSTATSNGDGDDSGDDTEDTSVEAPLAEQIAFDLQSGGAPVACGTQLTDLGTTDAIVDLLAAKLYVHGLQLSGPTSGTHTLVLADDGEWQDGAVALLDFDTDEGACAANGDARMNDIVVATVPAGDWDTLTFGVGVPFAHNHSDVVAAKPPLDLASMSWSWQAGRKFARIDVKVTDDATPFNFHLGSTGCVSDNAGSSPTEPCAKPNLPATISIPFDPATDKVVLDLARLYAATDLRNDAVSPPPGCMSNPMESVECDGIFGALGLSFGEGTCEDGCAGQTAFGAETVE